VSRRGWIVGGLLALAVVAVGATVVARHVIATDANMARLANHPIPVMVADARVGDLKETIGATGTLVPFDFASLTAKVSARVLTVTVNLGDIVTPGTVLVTFDTGPLKATLASATVERDRAKADAERARQQLVRVQNVYDQGVLPILDLEKAKAANDAAQAELFAAETKLVQAQLDLSYAVVTAPVASVVTQRLVNPGETPANNAPLLVLGHINPMLADAVVSEEHLGKIHLGQPATVTLPAYLNEDFKGTVVRIDPTANTETRTFQAFVRLANTDLRLKPGLTTFVRLERVYTKVLMVPSIALLNVTGLQESSLFVVENGRAHLRRVKIGVMGDGKTTIAEGVREGERVVTVGQLNLRDGDTVRLGDNDFNDLLIEKGKSGTAGSAR
jgi:membrane fusion protein (multidrug efflux system)